MFCGFSKNQKPDEKRRNVDAVNLNCFFPHQVQTHGADLLYSDGSISCPGHLINGECRVSHQNLVFYYFPTITHWKHLFFSSRNSRGCASCCLAELATLWGLSFLKAMASFHSLMPFGTCLWQWEQPYTTMPSGSTFMPSHPVRSRPPDDRADLWPYKDHLQLRWFSCEVSAKSEAALKKENLNLAKIKLYIKNTNGAFKWSSSTSSAVTPQSFSFETVFKNTIKHGAMLDQFVHIRTDTGYNANTKCWEHLTASLINIPTCVDCSRCYQLTQMLFASYKYRYISMYLLWETQALNETACF